MTYYAVCQRITVTFVGMHMTRENGWILDITKMADGEQVLVMGVAGSSRYMMLVFVRRDGSAYRYNATDEKREVIIDKVVAA